jgi:hypothetical protein
VSAESERVAGFGHLEDGLRQAGEWYRRFGDHAVMRRQLERLAESSSLANVEVRVLPLAGYHPIGAGTFIFMQFSQQYDVPFHDIVTVEHLDREYLIEDAADTNKYRVTFERLRGGSPRTPGKAQANQLAAYRPRSAFVVSRAHVVGHDELSEPGLAWAEFRPAVGEGQDRDRGGRELRPDPVERRRTVIAGQFQGQI